jgi:hypothetical protein
MRYFQTMFSEFGKSLFQVLVKPALDMSQADDAPIGAPVARQAVEFVRETDHLAVHSQALQGHKDLLALFDGAA